MRGSVEIVLISAQRLEIKDKDFSESHQYVRSRCGVVLTSELPRGDIFSMPITA